MTTPHAWVTALAGCALLCVSLITVHVRAEVYMQGDALARCVECCERLDRRATSLRLEFERLRQRAALTDSVRPVGPGTEGVRP